MNDIGPPTDDDRKSVKQDAGLYDNEPFWKREWEDYKLDGQNDTFRRNVLVLVHRECNAQELYDGVAAYTVTGFSDAGLAEWLKAFLRVKKSIPECIVSAVQDPYDDSDLIEPAEPRQSILNLLAKIRNNDGNGFHGLQCASTSGIDTAYFIGTPSFRHKGDPRETPATVYIQPRTESHSKSTVFVYYQESGSGKTVELSASTYTRNALFTIIPTYEGQQDVALIPDGHAAYASTDRYAADANAAAANAHAAAANAFTAVARTAVAHAANAYADARDDIKKDYRARDALLSLATKVRATLRADATSLKRLLKFVTDLDEARAKLGLCAVQTLQVVVGIDEATAFPNLVRAIVRDYSKFGVLLGHFIMHGCREDETDLLQFLHPDTESTPTPLELAEPKNSFKTLRINVLFSIAGTGVSQATVGSNMNNFDHMEVSAKAQPKEVYCTLRGEFAGANNQLSIIPDYDSLPQFPLLKALVDSNARMISIYMHESNQQQKSNNMIKKEANKDPHEQNAILSRTFHTFMGSNGMWRLQNNPSLRRLTAYRAFATLLFQQDQDFTNELSDDQVNNMDYGISFEDFQVDVQGGDEEGNVHNDMNESIMKHLVASYGLVTAMPFIKRSNNMPQAKPFKLSDAMQLLCLWLIQGGPEVPAEKSFMGTTSASFETLTALLVGAAIGASGVVKKGTDGRVLAAPADSNGVQQQEADIIAALGKVGMRINRHPTEVPLYTCTTISGEKPVDGDAGDLFWSLKGAHSALLSEDLKISGVYFHKSMMTCVKTNADVDRIKVATGTQVENALETGADIPTASVRDVARWVLEAIGNTRGGQPQEAIKAIEQVLGQFKAATAQGTVAPNATAEKELCNIHAAAAKTAGAIFRNMYVQLMHANGSPAHLWPLMDMTESDITEWLDSHHSIFVDHDLLRQLCVLRNALEQSNGGQDALVQSNRGQDASVAQLTKNTAALKVGNSAKTSHSARGENLKPASIPAPANASQGTTTYVVAYVFNAPLIQVSEGSSEFADAYVTFPVKQRVSGTNQKPYRLRTICIQAKDHAEDTSPRMINYLENALAVADPGLDPLFGEDRIYTIAGTHRTVAWGYEGTSFPYIPFAVDKSTILENQMEQMKKRHTKTAKHGAHAVLSIGPAKTEGGSAKQKACINRIEEEKVRAEGKKRERERKRKREREQPNREKSKQCI